MSNNLLQAYYRLPIEIVKGRGCYLYDKNHKKYLDFTSGIAVVNLGHNNKNIVSALTKQTKKLWHCSNIFNIPEQNKLADKLVNLSFADNVFFCSTGLEANETAIKLIRQYYYKHHHKENGNIIVFTGGFHGRSLGCISAGGNKLAKEGFGPLLSNFITIPINDIEIFKKTITKNNIAGVIVEPVQSEGGVIGVSHNFLRKIREITKKVNILLCLDEVQTAFGRTGTLFNYEQINIKPDLVTVAKAIGNGFPVAACLMTKHVAKVIKPGMHGSTFGGNPLAMSVANAVIDEMMKPELFSNVISMSSLLKEKLLTLQEKYQHIIKDVRVYGLLIGIEITSSAKTVMLECINNGLLVTKAGNDRVIRLLPPLIISEKEVTKSVRIIDKILSKYA